MNLLAGLNSQQHQAVTAAPGPTLIIAGPGSGKTRVLTHRIAYLISHLGVAPRSIMAVTFTNKAAKEMKARLENLLEGQMRGLTIGTFHAICARLLRREAANLSVNSEFVIFDESDQQSLVKQIVKDLNLNDKQYSPSKLLNRISTAKNELIGPEEFAANTYFNEVVKRVYKRYQEALTANNALDFDDLLMGVVQLLDKHPEVLAKYQRYYEYILVDEFQDTNTAQYALLKRLAQVKRNLYVVGDPDQSVYRWRGADYRNVRKFQEDYPDAQTILLEQNYRSTQLILDAAMAVIDVHPGRTRKQLFTERQGGVEITVYEAYNEQEESQFIIDKIQELSVARKFALGDFAVMYRTNAQSRLVEEAFVRARMPYKLVGAQRFYGRKEIKDALAYLRLIHNPADSVSLARVINTPSRGLGAKTLELLTATAQQLNQPATAVLLELANKGKSSPFALTFTGKAGTALAQFGQMLSHWLSAKSELAVAQLLDVVLDRVGYRDYILSESEGEEGEERWDNVLELRAVAAANPDISLTDFLQEVALVADQDTLAEEGTAPTLLTLHAAKGLEFPVVFIVGLDEGVLPHQRSFDEAESMHEERRLMYVGMTRAKDRLYLLRAFRRTNYGDSSLSEPSRFLNDIPERLLSGNLQRKQTSSERYFERATTWEHDDDDERPRKGRSLPREAVTQRAPTQKPPTTPARPMVVAQFKSGQRVRHAMFGEGIVIDSKIFGGEEEVNVAFDDVGLKRLSASAAKLEILKG